MLRYSTILRIRNIMSMCLKQPKASEAHEEIRNLKTYTKLKEARLLVVTTDK